MPKLNGKIQPQMGMGAIKRQDARLGNLHKRISKHPRFRMPKSRVHRNDRSVECLLRIHGNRNISKRSRLPLLINLTTNSKLLT